MPQLVARDTSPERSGGPDGAVGWQLPVDRSLRSRPAAVPRGLLLTLAGWLVAAVAVGASGALERLPRPALQGIIVVLTVAVLVACRQIPRLRAWAIGGDIRWLVGLHVTRLVAGLTFIWFHSRGLLPWGFAVPGGTGDAIVAALAIGVCLRPRRGLVLAWNTLGLVDILGVVVTAARFGVADPASMTALARIPLSLLPTFLVPLIIASHLVIFARSAQSHPRGTGEPRGGR